MGGGGKTTLARAVFDQMCIQFEGQSFVENVREVSKESFFGLKSLQKQVLPDILNDPQITVSSVYDGKNMIKKTMHGIKVLVVLDDVDHIDQLEALVGEPNWFKPGSRIIITTRDKQVLVAHRVNIIHDVNLLSNEEALCLFSRYAFGRDIPLKETLEKLELSYTALEEDYKEIFLDVACILKNWKKDRAIRVLEGFGYHARNGLRVLEQKSLIAISKFGTLDMHDHIEEMGKNIVRRLHPDEPSRHSRLWIEEEIKYILANHRGTKATRCIQLWAQNFDPAIVMKGLGNMKELRFLDVHQGRDLSGSSWHFEEVRKYLPNSLRFLHWYGYPFRCLPKTFRANNLVSLEMSMSRMVQVWEGEERKVLNKLRFLNLHHSKLLRTLDLSLTPNLEMLSLQECQDLLELHNPDGLPKLKHLNLDYSKIRYLNLGQTPDLRTLSLAGCCDLVELYIPF